MKQTVGNLLWGTTFGCQYWSGGTSFAKMSLGGGPLLSRTNFGVTVLLTLVYQTFVLDAQDKIMMNTL